MSWDIEKIKSVLPQREPFLFVDEVLRVDTDSFTVVAKKTFSPGEYFFKGHFPGNPIVPGVILIEAMAQASILLYAACKPEIAALKPDYYLGKVKSEFRQPVRPGEPVIMEIKGLKMINNAGVGQATAKVGENIVAKAEFIFGVIRKDAR
ncbi:MAG: 3-hydroxyacyl-ACP dehydratase FabZ [Candidatus Omnitrophica bacterium]|nr:3-hydroxyacyl-ACP dehydratase FabZ [Candidatus Omnitrophota bacterium]